MRLKFVVLFLIAILTVVILAAGIRILPATILLTNTPIGEEYDFMERQRQSIKIGPVEKTSTYILYPQHASEGGTQATGYVDFPEPDWFELAAESIIIPEGEVSEIAMWLNIPADEGFYNHHWLLGIPVMPVAIDGGGSQIQVGAYLLFRFETEAKAGVVPICAPNEMVHVPSEVKILNLNPGDTLTEVIQIYQGGEKAGLYTVSRLDPMSEVAQYTIKGTPGFPRLSEPGWITYPDTVVAPGYEEGGGTFPIRIEIPSNAQIRRFEEILLFEGGDTRPAFVRILVTMKQG